MIDTLIHYTFNDWIELGCECFLIVGAGYMTYRFIYSFIHPENYQNEEESEDEDEDEDEDGFVEMYTNALLRERQLLTDVISSIEGLVGGNSDRLILQENLNRLTLIDGLLDICIQNCIRHLSSMDVDDKDLTLELTTAIRVAIDADEGYIDEEFSIILHTLLNHIKDLVNRINEYLSQRDS